MMKLNLAITALVFLVMIGCGGGGSSSGGGTTVVPTNSAPVDLSAMVGEYRGSITLKVTADFIITTDTETYNRSMVATVTSDGRISLNFDNEVEAVGTLSNTASFYIQDTLRNAGFDCRGNLVIEGAIVGRTVRANVYSQNAKCDGIEGRANGSLVGNKV